MIRKKTWEEYRDTGLFWFINMILHAFGWAIVLVKDDGKIIDVHPARVRFRGFDEDSNTIGYKNVAKYMKEESDQIFKEAANQDECGDSN